MKNLFRLYTEEVLSFFKGFPVILAMSTIAIFIAAMVVGIVSGFCVQFFDFICFWVLSWIIVNLIIVLYCIFIDSPIKTIFSLMSIKKYK